MTCRTLMGGPLAKSTAHVGDHSRLTGPQLKEHGTGIRSPPLVAERSTRHAATSGERPQKKDGAQSRTQQSSDADIGSQCNKSHIYPKQRRNLGYYYYYYRLLLVSVQQDKQLIAKPIPTLLRPEGEGQQAKNSGEPVTNA